MTQRRILLFTLFMTLVFNAAYGGIELRSKQMRTSDGLPNNSVRYLYQDSKGFLWLATLNGLSRYDGNSFLTFRPEIGAYQIHSLKIEEIPSIQTKLLKKELGNWLKVSEDGWAKEHKFPDRITY